MNPSSSKHHQKVASSSSKPTSSAPKSKKVVSVSQKEFKSKEGEDIEMLKLQIEALQAQMEDQTKLAKDQVNALLEDRKVGSS